jgi:hypothetical protein
LLLAALVTAVTLCGCVQVTPDPFHGHGPPPHAPAHGYRSHHQGAELRFDRTLGVYVVAGYADHFYVDGRFLRLRTGRWETSPRLDGPWRAVSARSLPPGLARKSSPAPRKADHPGRARGNPAKLR